MTSRETFLNVSDQVVAAPGPGHYDPMIAQLHVKVNVHASVSSVHRRNIFKLVCIAAEESFVTAYNCFSHNLYVQCTEFTTEGMREGGANGVIFFST